MRKGVPEIAVLNKALGACIITPFGVLYRDQANPTSPGSYPHDSSNDYETSFFLELDDWQAAVADAMDYSSGSQDYKDANPVAVGIWLAVHYGSGTADAGHSFPDHDFSYGLRKRGITPTFSVSPVAAAEGDGPFIAMHDEDGEYVGAEKSGTTKTWDLGDPSQEFELDYWTAGTPDDRNWAQRVLDGDLDDWLDDFAEAAIAYKAITAPSGQSQPDPETTKNDKDEYYSDYDGIIVRFAFEMNGELSHSGPWEESGGSPTSDTQRGIDELMAAWAYVADRVRRTEHDSEYATNVHFFYCPNSVAAGTIRDVRENWWAPTKIIAGGLVQFLGIDHYKAGTGFNAQMYLPEDTTTPFLEYKHVFANSNWGQGDLPMLIGEYGLRYQYGPEADGPGEEMRDWNCSVVTGAYNERCRGRILLKSKDKLVDRCANGPQKTNHRALRGVFYMAVDLVPPGVTRTVGSESQQLPDQPWGLWGGSQPKAFRDGDGDWELEQYLKSGGATEDREKRGTLEGMAAGTWPGAGANNDTKYSAWNWARQRTTWKWRGKGGALFTSLD